MSTAKQSVVEALLEYAETRSEHDAADLISDLLASVQVPQAQDNLEKAIRSTDQAVRLAAIEETLRRLMRQAQAAGYGFVRGTFSLRPNVEGKLCTCAIGAASLGERGPEGHGRDGTDATNVFQWGKKRFGMTKTEVAGVAGGFDGCRPVGPQKEFITIGNRLWAEFGEPQHKGK